MNSKTFFTAALVFNAVITGLSLASTIRIAFTLFDSPSIFHATIFLASLILLVLFVRDDVGLMRDIKEYNKTKDL
jgi:hypothetical protein